MMTRETLAKTRIAKGTGINGAEAPGCLCNSGAIIYRSRRDGRYYVAGSELHLRPAMRTMQATGATVFDRGVGIDRYRYIYAYKSAPAAKAKFWSLLEEAERAAIAERSELRQKAACGDTEALNSWVVCR